MIVLMKRSPLYVVARALILGFYKIFMPYQVNYKECLPKLGRVVICSNHLSWRDPILVAAINGKRQVHYMGKAELFKNKLIGCVLRAVGAFPVNRGKGDRAAIDFAKQLLDQEQVVGIFIEGTRSRTGEFLQPKSGAVVLAHANNAPILPVCITPIDGKRPRLFRKVYVSCGELIPPEELGITGASPKEYREASRLVMDRIKALREQDLKC